MPSMLETSKKIAVVALVLASACASTALAILPKLELRTLHLSPKGPYLEYRWRECASRFLGQCTKWEQKTETYDLEDAVVRAKLINMGFVMKVRELPVK